MAFKETLAISMTFVLWSRVNCILEYHTHVHRHLKPSDRVTDFSSLKGNVGVNNIPSAGDGALNPWFYRFPPWTEHNPPPPTLALTNGDALKSIPKLKDISSLRRAPRDEERFVFHDVKVDLDMPYVHEVVKTVLATQGQGSEDGHLAYGDDDYSSNHASREKDRWLSSIYPQNGLLNSYENSITSPNYPTKPSFRDRTSSEIHFMKTNDVFPLYEAYAKSNLDSKYVQQQPEDFSFPEDRSLGFHQQNSFPIDNSIDSTQILFPANELTGKLIGKTKNPGHVEELSLMYRGWNSRLSSSVKDSSKYPSSIQDIINGQLTSHPNDLTSQIDPRHNRPSRQIRLSRRSKLLGNKWVWSEDPDR